MEFAEAVLKRSDRALTPAQIIREGLKNGLHTLLHGRGLDETSLRYVLLSDPRIELEQGKHNSYYLKQNEKPQEESKEAVRSSRKRLGRETSKESRQDDGFQSVEEDDSAAESLVEGAERSPQSHCRAKRLWVVASEESDGYCIRGEFVCDGRISEMTLYDAITEEGFELSRDWCRPYNDLSLILIMLSRLCRKLSPDDEGVGLTHIPARAFEEAKSLSSSRCSQSKRARILEPLCPQLRSRDELSLNAYEISAIHQDNCHERDGAYIWIRVSRDGFEDLELSVYRARKLGITVPHFIKDVYSRIEDAKLVADDWRQSIRRLKSVEESSVIRPLMPYGMKVVISRLVDAWKAGDEKAKRALTEAQSFTWCFDSFAVHHPLLCVLQVGQSVPSAYCILDVLKYPRVLLLNDWSNADCFAILKWCEKAGISAVEWKYLAEEERRRTRAVKKSPEVVKSLTSDLSRNPDVNSHIRLVSRLKEAIRRDYPSGLILNNSTITLLEGSLGSTLGEQAIRMAKNEMFERTDGILLYREMIVDDSVLERLVSRAREFIDSEGFFSLDALLAEFDGAIRNLPDDGDFKKFFNDYVAEKIGGKIRGTKGRRMCFKMSGSDEECWRIVADSVRSKLLEAGDARSLDDLLTELPHLNRDVVEHVAESVIEDAVLFDIDETKFVKLLEAYYLPEDFAEVLKAFIDETESQSAVVSITLLDEFLNSNYGDGFRMSYGLEDDSVYKQVISKSVRDSARTWKGDLYISASSNSARNIADEYMSRNTGPFHEDDFFAYAAERRGLTNHASLICQYLRPRCVRLNRVMWMNAAEFIASGAVTAEVRNSLSNMLVSLLGNADMLHIGLIPEVVLSDLPELWVNGKCYPWNHYLVTSIAKQCLHEIRIVNDEPSPYFVTAMVVPERAEIKGDAVDYVLEIFKKSGRRPSNVDEMFDYMKSNLVRMTKTAKLVERISEFWGF